MIVHRYGGFWRRGAAILIDKFILNILSFILVFLEISVLPESPYSHYPDSSSGIQELMSGHFLIGHIIVFTLMGAVYFTYFHAAFGQTPGKMLLKLKVIGTTGRGLTYGAALLRWFCYILSLLPFYMGFIWAAFDGKKQAWHDKLAGTLVIRLSGDEGSTDPRQLKINI